MATRAVFLHVAKAFDKVWHQGLLYKMMEAYIHHKIITIFVKVEGMRFTERCITTEVPQGRILAPKFFDM